MLYVAFRDTNLEELGRGFSSARWWPVLPFLLYIGIHLILRSWRWRFLLPAPQQRPVSLRMLFDSMILGNLATFLLPFRLGEFIRPLVLSRWTEYSFASAFISVVIERFFDLSAVLISFMIVVQLLPDVPNWLHVAAYSLGTMAGGLLVFLAAGCLFPELIMRIMKTCAAPLPARLGSLIVSFGGDLVQGARVIGTPSRLLAIILLTTGVWLTAYLQFHALLFMFPFNTSFLLSVALGVFVALAIALPSAPGFVGVFQIGCVAACSLFAYPDSEAKVYSLIVHALTYIVFVVIGFWLLTVHNMSLFELKKAAEQGNRG
jgi:uncharacterized protein (TIRG00374 family)